MELLRHRPSSRARGVLLPTKEFGSPGFQIGTRDRDLGDPLPSLPIFRLPEITEVSLRDPWAAHCSLRLRIEMAAGARAVGRRFDPALLVHVRVVIAAGRAPSTDNTTLTPPSTSLGVALPVELQAALRFDGDIERAGLGLRPALAAPRRAGAGASAAGGGGRFGRGRVAAACGGAQRGARTSLHTRSIGQGFRTRESQRMTKPSRESSFLEWRSYGRTPPLSISLAHAGAQ